MAKAVGSHRWMKVSSPTKRLNPLRGISWRTEAATISTPTMALDRKKSPNTPKAELSDPSLSSTPLTDPKKTPSIAVVSSSRSRNWMLKRTSVGMCFLLIVTGIKKNYSI
jgi:hypothetical protein